MNQRRIWWITGILLSALIPVVATLFVAPLLEKDVKLTYYKTQDISASVGLSKLTANLEVKVQELKYKNSTYENLRLVSYILQNEDIRSVNRPSSYYFVGLRNGRTEGIKKDAVIDINWTSITTQPSVPLLKRIDDPEIGHGFKIVSSFPGKSQMEVTLVIDVDKQPSIKDLQVVIGNEAGAGSLTEKKLPRTFALSLSNILVIIIIAAAAWASLWMFINYKLGIETAGQRIFKRIFQRH